ncbi:hypothetical protein [Lacinutrix himadriensis]|uniref:hypothetical protein n=1 Tax=Lacinutrix himadriensis TaxID=641549 RepID=UPI0006E24584|nr:hypothetical protein [Lacinutrix himadriensis]
MKKEFLIVFILVFFSSCSSSNEEGETQSSSCSKILSLTAFDVGNTTANLFWTANDNSSTFEVEYGIEGFSLGNGTTINATATSLFIDGLVKSTDYSYYVRAFCEDTNSNSEWSDVYSFKTKEENPFCNDPLLMQVKRKPWLHPTETHNTIHVEWSGGSVDGLEVQYGPANFSLDQGTIVTVQNTSSIGSGSAPISGLESDTAYHFYIRNICSNAGYSGWLGPEWIYTEETPFNVHCKDPTDFDIGPGTGNGWATFNWSDNSESSWDIHIIPEGSPINLDATNTFNVTDNTFGLYFTNQNGYVHGQGYDFYIRANCGVDGNSDWYGPTTFTAGF